MVKVPLNKKFLFALCTVGYSMAGMLIGAAMLKFYTDFIGLPPLYFGIANLCYGIWNGINDIIIGYYSDMVKYHPKKGKRKRLMKWSIPFGVIGFFILIFNQPSWSALLIFLILLLGLCLYDLAVTIYGINYGALILGITEDPNERASMGIIAGYLNLIPNAIMSYLPLILLTKEYSLQFIVFIFTLIGMLSFSMNFYFFMKIDEPLRDQKLEIESVPPITAVKECLKFKTFRYNIVLAFTMAGIGSFGSTVLYILFDIYELLGIYAILPPIIAGGSQPLMMPIILKIQKKIGFRRTFLIFQGLAFVGYLGFLLIINYWLLFIFYFFILTSMSANGICGSAYGPIPIYEDYIKKGTQRAGMFGGVGAIFTIPATGIFIFIFTIFLTLYGYDGTSTSGQTEQALLGIRLGFALPPLIFLAICLLLMYKYPIYGEKFEDLQKEIRKLYGEENSQVENGKMEHE